MRRREFIALMGGAAAALSLLWPRAARAQQRMPTIGYLGTASLERERKLIAGFHRGLAETGYVEGRNVAIEYRWAEDQNDRLPALAADLVRRQVAVIVTGTTPAALAAKAATQTIPIVFSVGSNPVEMGLIASLNRPGGNLTGVSGLNIDIFAKRLELLHELAPAATQIAVLVNPTNPNTEPSLREAQVAARVLGVRLSVLNVSSESELDRAFAMLVGQRAGALLAHGDSIFSAYRDRLIALAARHAVPAIYQFREFAVAGGLMSYGTDLTDEYRQVGVYTGRILKGDKPADLPVQQATRFETVLNLKTAKALGLTVPTSTLLRADEVIE
jgi:putative ABC transport system substrate-binding protein